MAANVSASESVLQGKPTFFGRPNDRRSIKLVGLFAAEMAASVVAVPNEVAQ